MATLTDRRLEAATPILERYRASLFETRRISSDQLEHELRDCWGLDYQELKDLMIELFERPRFRLVAAYYMQNQNGSGPVDEFKESLARLYGTTCYDPFDKDGSRAALWRTAFDSGG